MYNRISLPLSLSDGVCQCSRMEDGSGVRVAERCDGNVLLAYLVLCGKIRAVPRKNMSEHVLFNFLCVCVCACVCVRAYTCAWENPFSLSAYTYFPPSHLPPAPPPFPSAYRFINACKRLLSFTHSFIHSFIHPLVRSSLRNSHMISYALDI